MSDLIVSTLTQGLIYALLSYGVYITYSVLDFPDLTVDSSFPLGAAVTAILLLGGVDPWLTLLCAAGAGALAGLCTGLIHVRLGVRDLLAGIITMTALFSINLQPAPHVFQRVGEAGQKQHPQQDAVELGGVAIHAPGSHQIGHQQNTRDDGSRRQKDGLQPVGANDVMLGDGRRH